MYFIKGFIVVLLINSNFILCHKEQTEIDESRILRYVINSKERGLKFYWKDNRGEIYGNFQNLNLKLVENNEELIFCHEWRDVFKRSISTGLIH